jgi:hypothetical protein
MEPMQNQDPNRELVVEDPRLTNLWLAYRDACPDPEPRADFMPRMWQKIEAQRTQSLSLSIFKRLAQVCVATTAVALALLSALPTPSADDALDPGPYTEILAADQTQEAYSIIHPAILAPEIQGDQN